MFHRLNAPAAIGLLLAAFALQAHAAEVIRIAGVPQERYAQLHEMADFWGLDPKSGDVIMYVTERQRAAIESRGYEVRRDEQRMRSLDYARSIDVEAWERSGAGGIPGYACYRTVEETKNDLSGMATERPDLARWESIGQSWLEANGEAGGDDLYVLVLGNQNSPHEQAPFVLMAAQHARELTTAETATRFAEWLFDHYDTDPTARWLLDHREIHIIAQQNPDGRREVETGSAMWRKNSNLGACSSGSWTGIDLNRNNDYFFNGPSTSSNPCEQIYPGVSEHSEPETQAIHAYLDQVFERHRPGDPNDLPTDPVPAGADGLFISLHSFGNLVLFPWEGKGSGTANHSPNHEQLAWLGRRFGFYTGYNVGRAILYAAGGTTTDFAYGEFGVAAYTYEIGSEFQEQCGAFENNLWPDLRDSLIYAAKAAARPYQAPSGPDVIDAIGAVDVKNSKLYVSGMIDDTRFDRGGSPEGPSGDPIEDVAELRVSLDAPPQQAGTWYTVAPEAQAPVTAFDEELSLSETITLPRLVFFQAVDSAGNLGVPEAAWITERIATVSPGSLSATLQAGQTGQETVTIANIGSEDLNWSIATDVPASLAGGSHLPALNENLDIGDFSLGSGGSASVNLPGGVDTRGQVVGFSFEGTVANLGNNAWASDMAMTITAPEGEIFTVGGYQTSNPDWDFQGSGSGSAGTYSSSHIGSDIFGETGALDEGDWSFDFEDTWTGGMDWSNVTITLHKQEAPTCIAPAGVAWLSLDQGSGTLASGEDAEILVAIDASGLAEGTHQALLCVTTDDPSAQLIEIPVQLEVISDPQIFEDRFEAALR